MLTKRYSMITTVKLLWPQPLRARKTEGEVLLIVWIWGMQSCWLINIQNKKLPWKQMGRTWRSKSYFLISSKQHWQLINWFDFSIQDCKSLPDDWFYSFWLSGTLFLNKVSKCFIFDPRDSPHVSLHAHFVMCRLFSAVFDALERSLNELHRW